jgi:hypothetical protein
MSVSDKDRRSLAFLFEVHIGLPFRVSEPTDKRSFPMRTKETEVLETNVASGLIDRRPGDLKPWPGNPRTHNDKRGAVERTILEQRLRDLPRLQIDDLNALFAPAAEHDHGSVLFRREYEIDRQAAEVYRFAGGIESHACRQRRSEERLPLCGHRRAEQCRKRESESTDTKRKHNRRSSQTWHNRRHIPDVPASIRLEPTYRTESAHCAMPCSSHGYKTR